MLLATFAVLITLGLAVWYVGHTFRYLGVAAIGAAVIIVAGSAVALTGLAVRTGETRVMDYTTVNNTTVANSTTISYEYQTTSLADVLGAGVLGSLGFGGLVMLLGVVLFSQSLQANS